MEQKYKKFEDSYFCKEIKETIFKLIEIDELHSRIGSATPLGRQFVMLNAVDRHFKTFGIKNVRELRKMRKMLEGQERASEITKKVYSLNSIANYCDCKSCLAEIIKAIANPGRPMLARVKCRAHALLESVKKSVECMSTTCEHCFDMAAYGIKNCPNGGFTEEGEYVYKRDHDVTEKIDLVAHLFITIEKGEERRWSISQVIEGALSDIPSAELDTDAQIEELMQEHDEISDFYEWLGFSDIEIKLDNNYDFVPDPLIDITLDEINAELDGEDDE